MNRKINWLIEHIIANTPPVTLKESCSNSGSKGGAIGGAIGGSIGGTIGGIIGGTIGGIMDLTDRQREILALIARDNQLTVTALSSLLKINRSAAQAHIDALKTKGVLKRVGGTRGYWQVITNN